MSPQTVTHSVETDCEPAKLFRVLCEVERIPVWAPVFADSTERISESRWRLIKDGEAFEVEVLKNEVACTVDYIRQMSGGKRGGAYIRVTPRPLGGSSISMTVPVSPDTTPTDVAMVLQQELVELVRLAQS